MNSLPSDARSGRQRHPRTVVLPRDQGTKDGPSPCKFSAGVPYLRPDQAPPLARPLTEKRTAVPLTVDEIAEVCHEANRALQRIHGDPAVPVAPAWHEFPYLERLVGLEGVGHALAGATPAELHESWCQAKRRNGWTYGKVKDADAKTHPCLVDYDLLPAEQQAKDALFGAIVDALGEVADRPRPLDLDGRHPSVVSAARYLEVNPNLPGHLATVARICQVTARAMVECLDDSPELAAGLRKLLEAKDCFVRAAL